MDPNQTKGVAILEQFAPKLEIVEKVLPNCLVKVRAPGKLLGIRANSEEKKWLIANGTIVQFVDWANSKDENGIPYLAKVIDAHCGLVLIRACDIDEVILCVENEDEKDI